MYQWNLWSVTVKLIDPKKFFMIFVNLKISGITIPKTHDELKQDLDGIKSANMLPNMLTKENSGYDINGLMGLFGYIEEGEENTWICL